MLRLRDPKVLGILLLAAIWPAHPRASAVDASAAELQDELAASHREWQENDARFRSMRKKETASSVNVDEYAQFVASLQRKMLENCQVLRSAGLAPEKLVGDCGLPNEQRSPDEALARDPKAIQTKEEQAAALERDLNQSLTKFDEQMRGKQAELRAAQVRQGAGGYPREVARASGSENAEEDLMGSGPGQTPAQTLASEGRKSSPLADPGAGPGLPRTAALAPSRTRSAGGNDDDVVAGQLREAAEKENDPLLKEKLWDEYRKYKAN